MHGMRDSTTCMACAMCIMTWTARLGTKNMKTCASAQKTVREGVRRVSGQIQGLPTYTHKFEVKYRKVFSSASPVDRKNGGALPRKGTQRQSTSRQGKVRSVQQPNEYASLHEEKTACCACHESASRTRKKRCDGCCFFQISNLLFVAAGWPRAGWAGGRHEQVFEQGCYCKRFVRVSTRDLPRRTPVWCTEVRERSSLLPAATRI